METSNVHAEHQVIFLILFHIALIARGALKPFSGTLDVVLNMSASRSIEIHLT